MNARRNARPLDASPNEPPVDTCKTGLDATVVSHIRLTVSLIEGRAVGLNEVIELVRKILRQLSIGRSKGMYYTHGQSQTNPP